MPVKHRSIVYLKAVMPLLSEEEPDWDTIEELFTHATTYINNSLAAHRGTYKQVNLSFTSSDQKPIAPKEAEKVFHCTFCQMTGTPSDSDKHQCDEGDLALALKRRCVLCGGYVQTDDEMQCPEGLAHNYPCTTGEPDVITDEAKQLPDLTTPEGEPPNLPPWTEEQGERLKKLGKEHGLKIYPWVCLTCGDSFLARQTWESHLKTHTKDEPKPISFRVTGLTEVEPNGTPTFYTQAGDYTKEQVFSAFGLTPDVYLWLHLEGAFSWCFIPGMMSSIGDRSLWVVTKDKYITSAKYSCLLCGEDYLSDDIEIDAEGYCICHSCNTPKCSTCDAPYTGPIQGKKGKLLCEACNTAKKAAKPKKKTAKESPAETLQ